MKVWDIDNPRAQRISRRLGEMVAIDCHSLSVIEDVGFNRVLRTLEPKDLLWNERRGQQAYKQ